ncbi:MAG TPA: hypothetical protein ENI45_00650, partial [Thermoplasmatales archaeon]|nr:hypothetical protein [Thermoplasmatales archaeon]
MKVKQHVKTLMPMLIVFLLFTIMVAGLNQGMITINVSDTDGVDWWPMFQHDPWHTGFSNSLAPETKHVKWSRMLGGSIGFSSPAVVDGKIYVGSHDQRVYCLDACNGSEIWCYTTGDIIVSSPAVQDNRVYVGSCDGKIYCLNADTGSKIWSY